MGVAECLNDIRTPAAKLSNENKKYVIAVAQALLFTQKGTKTEQDNSSDKVALLLGERKDMKHSMVVKEKGN